ncbi:MAG: LysR family transcriptional regulator [Minwuia sp.]|nr:LysR family transcriptional regulator [Minwuia sp.]
MNTNLDIGLVRAFALIAETGSMTRAAELLGVSQGAVSQRIQRLEELLRCTLFTRGKRSLSLSPQGQRLLPACHRLLQANDAVISEILPQAVTGKVRFGVPFDLVPLYLPLALRGFSVTCPSVEVEVVTAASPELKRMFTRREVDLALLEEPVERISGECLSVESLHWIAGPEGNAGFQRPLPLSIISETCAFRPAMIGSLQAAGIDWRPVQENGSIDATMAVVRAGLAVSTSLRAAVPADIMILGPESGLPDLPRYAISLFAGRTGESPAVAELARHVRDAVRTR